MLSAADAARHFYRKGGKRGWRVALSCGGPAINWLLVSCQPKHSCTWLRLWGSRPGPRCNWVCDRGDRPGEHVGERGGDESDRRARPDGVPAGPGRDPIDHLQLRKPIFKETARHGHFGRIPIKQGGFSWAKLDKVEELRKAAKISAPARRGRSRAPDQSRALTSRKHQRRTPYHESRYVAEASGSSTFGNPPNG
jgi:hypothetical protein